MGQRLTQNRLTCLVLALALSVSAADYYVDPAGGQDTHDGRAAQAGPKVTDCELRDLPGLEAIRDGEMPADLPAGRGCDRALLDRFLHYSVTTTIPPAP